MILAVSGGADSMALLHACAFLHRRGEIRARTITVDHGLQSGSAEVAAAVRAASVAWGVPAETVRVEVTAGAEGLEAAARSARYAALEAAAEEHRAEWILTGHTRRDQAETVLLGLMRGSGTRSLAGMAPRTGRILRPLLDLDRTVTERSCRAQGIEVWHDPMNEDPAYSRVRVRTLLGRLEAELGRPLSANLARTADLCRADADHLEALAAGPSAEAAGQSQVPIAWLDELPEAVLTRVLRSWLVSLGVPGQEFGAERIAEIAALVRGTGQRNGRGPRRLSLPRDTEVIVDNGMLEFRNRVAPAKRNLP